MAQYPLVHSPNIDLASGLIDQVNKFNLFAIIDNLYIVSSIARVLACRYPSAIGWLIIPINIDPVNLKIFPVSILKRPPLKRREVITPFIADLSATEPARRSKSRRSSFGMFNVLRLIRFNIGNWRHNKLRNPVSLTHINALFSKIYKYDTYNS